jgi:hypothetical protein
MSKRILYPVFLAIGNEGIGAMYAHAARSTQNTQWQLVLRVIQSAVL